MRWRCEFMKDLMESEMVWKCPDCYVGFIKQIDDVLKLDSIEVEEEALIDINVYCDKCMGMGKDIN